MRRITPCCYNRSGPKSAGRTHDGANIVWIGNLIQDQNQFVLTHFFEGWLIDRINLQDSTLVDSVPINQPIHFFRTKFAPARWQINAFSCQPVRHVLREIR